MKLINEPGKLPRCLVELCSGAHSSLTCQQEDAPWQCSSRPYLCWHSAGFVGGTLLPLDDVVVCLKDTIPTLSRSVLHQSLQRYGILRMPITEDAHSKHKAFKETQIGYVHIDSAQPRSAKGVTHMVLAIDRVSKFAYVAFHATAEMATGSAFLRGVIAAFLCQIRGVLTDNGVTFTKNASAKWNTMRHPFDRLCKEHDIKHRLTKPYHPWTNGQAERMIRPSRTRPLKASAITSWPSCRPVTPPNI